MERIVGAVSRHLYNKVKCKNFATNKTEAWFLFQRTLHKVIT